MGWVYGLRTISAERTSYGGFKWPEFGGEPVRVHAPDWDPRESCGNGLHFLLWGEGEALLLSTNEDAIWQVVRTTARHVDLGGKVKVPWLEIVFEGTRVDAVARLQAIPETAGKKVVFGTATAGYYATATAGDYDTATAGYYATATAGDYGTATAGDYGIATAGYYGIATAGYSATATAGDYGTATAGDYGIATAGDYGTATAGYYGTATAGYSGTATAGEDGVISIQWWDGTKERYRRFVSNVGENGIEANVAYKVDENGHPYRADKNPGKEARGS